MSLNAKATASLVFLILYAFLFAILLFGFLTRRLKLFSRYSGILFHVVVRLASQATGLAFGVTVVGYANTSLLVACFVLGVIGYYALTLCTFCFLVLWQNHNCTSDSWVKPRRASGTPWHKKLISCFALVSNRRPTSALFILLTAAFSIIVSGGTSVDPGTTDGSTVQQPNRNLPAAKWQRTAGQAVLLIVNIFLLYCIVETIRQSHRENPRKRPHPILLLLLATCPLLLVRGVYGVMSGVLPAFNYFNPDNYGESGMTRLFVISEYIMGTATEWISCTLLMLAYFTLMNDSEVDDLELLTGKMDRSGGAVGV